MKITSVNEIDLTKYKLAFYTGNSRDCDHSYEKQLQLAQAGITDDMPSVSIWLIPIDDNLTKIWGDDFDDAPAQCNAEWPNESTLPRGSILISGVLGKQLELRTTIQ